MSAFRSWQSLILGLFLSVASGLLILGALWLSLTDRAMAPLSPVPPTEIAWVLPTSTRRTTPSHPAHTPGLPTPGVTPGLISTPTPLSVLYPTLCAPPAGWLPYTVRRGDTLYGLAWRSGVSPLLIIQGNCLGTDFLQAGRVVYLPPTFFVTPTRVPCGPPPGWVRYFVQPGDTLWNLSFRLGVSIEAIRLANCMTDYVLRVGQPLYLPAYPPPLTPTRTPTRLPTAVYTATPTPSLTPTPTGTPTGTPTPTSTPARTETPTVTPTPTPTDTPTPTPLPTATPLPSPTPTPETPSPTPVPPTPTPVPSPGPPTPETPPSP
ncbi:MAG: LysM peptidoglycan-binding domain-containing protein [Anaerolineae bacterium]|nr:LysM peptidoglycan-binding domain-containing protein [Anaerolineae bacterium]MCX8067870.1 LysM peptidoglycan-binding domain-containing protein [Anaerolineae bacterium]